jgi:V/A-type H+-transporting ATPase subunit E
MNGIPAAAEAIKKEILDNAARRAAAITAAAEEKAAKVVRAAEDEARALLLERGEKARSGAALRRAALLASVEVEAARARASLKESGLEKVRSAAAAAAGGMAGSRVAAVKLAAAAIGRMEGAAFTVKISPELARGGTAGIAEEIAAGSGRGKLEIHVEEDPACSGGALVTGAGGRQRWDNSFGARLARLWPALRCAITLAEKGEG